MASMEIVDCRHLDSPVGTEGQIIRLPLCQLGCRLIAKNGVPVPLDGNGVKDCWFRRSLKHKAHTCRERNIIQE